MKDALSSRELLDRGKDKTAISRKLWRGAFDEATQCVRKAYLLGRLAAYS